MRMLDLFCGRWGWSRAFAARGWECVGFDLVKPPEIPDRCCFVQQDILELTLDQGFLDFWEPDFICASSPCEQFSVHGMKHFHPNPPYPEMGIRLFSHTRSICEASGLPYVMENVRAAQQFVGRAAHHCGPFYLWGSGVPALMPQGISKGMSRRAMGQREYKGQPGWNTKNDLAPRRLNGDGCASMAATIPSELANCVVDYAERLLEAAA
jgi:C-5 cytosine-specific DNA methylase